MNINRDNYEEIFMLYADNELAAEEREAVEIFVEQNTDLAAELNLLKQLQFKPDADLVFMNKESLFRNESEHETININNYEEFFVLYADNELNNEQQISVEKFVYKNPSVQSEFELIQETKLEADNSVVYEGKEDLYRYEKDEKVVPLFISIRAWKWAAAAILILLAGFIWLNQNSKGKLPENTARVENGIDKKEIVPSIDKPEIVIEEQVAAADKKAELKTPTADVKNDNAVVLASVDKNSSAKKKKDSRDANVAEVNTEVEAKKDLVALQHMSPEKISPVTSSEININTAKNAANPLQHKEPIIDKAIYIDTEKENKEISYAALSDDKNVDDVLYVSNTAVRKQNPLRGIFRKASRFVERTTNAKPADGGILIGNLSIALR